MNFQNIKGHHNQLKYLSRIKSGGNIPHSLLFSGQQGIGKRLIAELFATSVFCSEENSPCGKCFSCIQMKAGTYPDFIILERDDKGKIPIGSSDRPNSVRWMIDRLMLSSVKGKYIAIVDGVETISEAGQNALLKTIEEPGEGAHIILIAESKSGILPTIVSRCIEINFNPLQVSDIKEIVAEKFPEGNNSEIISSICGGSADIALLLHDEKVFNEVMDICREMKVLLRGSGIGGKFPDIPGGSESGFILTVLINLYSLMIREHIAGLGNSLPGDVLIDIEEAEKLVKILLAIKKGLKNNLNVKNILKGMIYSVSGMKSSGFYEPDFSWL